MKNGDITHTYFSKKAKAINLLTLVNGVSSQRILQIVPSVGLFYCNALRTETSHLQKITASLEDGVTFPLS